MQAPRVIRVGLSLAAALSIASCGGGGGDAGNNAAGGSSYSVAGGTAEKGALLRGSSIRIDELNPLTYAPAGTVYDLQTNDNYGGFSTGAIAFTRQHIQTTAQGYYFNEITGTQADDWITLQGQSDLVFDRLVNINTLTTLANSATVALVTNSASPATYKSFTAARALAQRQALAPFYIYNTADLLPGGVSGSTLIPGAFGELNISQAGSANATVAAANQILVAISALAVQAGANGVGISQFLTNLQQDLADDGLANGTNGAVNVTAQINSAPAGRFTPGELK